MIFNLDKDKDKEKEKNSQDGSEQESGASMRSSQIDLECNEKAAMNRTDLILNSHSNIELKEFGMTPKNGKKDGGTYS